MFESWGELLKNMTARATPDQLELILGWGGALGSWSFLEGCEMLISGVKAEGLLLVNSCQLHPHPSVGAL